jgi:hypothetical protein
MCASCGCGTPNNDHGDRRNITLDQVKQAAAAAGIPISQAGENVADATFKAAEDRDREARRVRAE